MVKSTPARNLLANHLEMLKHIVSEGPELTDNRHDLCA